jgi:hypothetical protein
MAITVSACQYPLRQDTPLAIPLAKRLDMQPG